MSTMADDITPMTRERVAAGPTIGRLTAVLLLAVTTTVTCAIAPSAATNGAHFTSLERSLADLDDDPTTAGDSDSLSNDLVVSFSEVGVGQETVSVTVSTRRTVVATCVSAAGEFPAMSDEPLDVDYSESFQEDGSVEVTSDENGKISGLALLLTDVYDACPQFHPDYDATAVGTVYAARGYRVVYEHVTVTDKTNMATLTIDEPITYSAECVVTNSEAYAADEEFVARMLLQGVACMDVAEFSGEFSGEVSGEVSEV